ncbi:hypothetical protein BpHYR1_013034 [Brachionus plicatilis]|uniref:Uncharacterized protein n=1 Tax=Brachionus plicatilis TaxID=10195 RepID=A0A3M7SI73_BRAPC|nr:hypothetical protein BpHYR1_013034 [Brachionus plicatilis]
MFKTWYFCCPDNDNAIVGENCRLRINRPCDYFDFFQLNRGYKLHKKLLKKEKVLLEIYNSRENTLGQIYRKNFANESKFRLINRMKDYEKSGYNLMINMWHWSKPNSVIVKF